MAKVDIESTDRRVKWWLLIVSLATLAVLIAAALQENVFPEWRSTNDPSVAFDSDGVGYLVYGGFGKNNVDCECCQRSFPQAHESMVR